MKIQMNPPSRKGKNKLYNVLLHINCTICMWFTDATSHRRITVITETVSLLGSTM